MTFALIQRMASTAHTTDVSHTTRQFMFASGVENSYPVVPWEGKQVRRDGMELSGHYDRWKQDFELVEELGIRYLRYGAPYYRVNKAESRYDWEFPDQTFAALKKLDITPITDMCHFGVPDWIGGFDNPDWPTHFANYAHAFAHRFPWVRFYTPVNEIFQCALWSGLRGYWNEQGKSDRQFVLSVKHMCQATLLAEEAILKVQPKAMFVQSEATSYFHRQNPNASQKAYFDNELRFLALDLCYGHDVSGAIREYIQDNGLSKSEYDWFMRMGQSLRPHCIMGNDYYPENEHMVHADGSDDHSAGEVFGYYVITHQYFDRYHLPVMHTETNRRDNAQHALDWLQKQWLNIIRLMEDGVPIFGFTWYSVIDQTDWDSGLRELNFRTDPCGLFDKQRHPHPVAKEYARIIREWGEQVPADSVCRAF